MTDTQIPGVEVTVSKILDGYPSLNHLATNGRPEHIDRSNPSTKDVTVSGIYAWAEMGASIIDRAVEPVKPSIVPDCAIYATDQGSGTSYWIWLTERGDGGLDLHAYNLSTEETEFYEKAYLSHVKYEGLEENASEDTCMVGNTKIWEPTNE